MAPHDVETHGRPTPEHLDVLIVGAGLSGIGAACYLQDAHPDKSFALLEARGATGGTWDLFRYPGIRSDSDLHTFGYEFKPWTEDKAIADGPSILAYIRETAREHRVDEKVRLHHAVQGAAWSSAESRWLVDVERKDTGERLQLSCRWLFCAGGYYRYDRGYTPTFEGRERFEGTIVHPQLWPEDLDYRGKRVVIIGSGATAVTLGPAMTDKAAQVTMLQRTPTYILPLPAVDPINKWLKRLLPAKLAYDLTRRKNIARQRFLWRWCQRRPEAARKWIRKMNAKHLPAGYDIDTHFNPPYNPWEQRLCAVPDGDLFDAIGTGRLDVVTDHIETFEEQGILLRSGKRLEADIIITATGLELRPVAGMKLTVDGEDVHLPDKVVFKGMMLSGVPNFSLAVGYTNSSWTLKIGLLCEHFCRLLGHMDEGGYTSCRAEVADPDMPTRPLLDFGAGYIQRSMHLLPRQGPAFPWLASMDYHSDVALLRNGPIADPHLRFEGPDGDGSGRRLDPERVEA